MKDAEIIVLHDDYQEEECDEHVKVFTALLNCIRCHTKVNVLMACTVPDEDADELCTIAVCSNTDEPTIPRSDELDAALKIVRSTLASVLEPDAEPLWYFDLATHSAE